MLNHDGYDDDDDDGRPRTCGWNKWHLLSGACACDRSFDTVKIQDLREIHRAKFDITYSKASTTTYKKHPKVPGELQPDSTPLK